MARFRLKLSPFLLTTAVFILTFALILGEARTDSGGGNDESRIQLVAVQMSINIEDYLSKEAFENKIRELMKRVEGKIDRDLPTLVAFPEGIGFMLAALGMDKEDLEGSATVSAAIRGVVSPSQTSASQFYLSRSGRIAEAYFGLFSELSKEYGVYIVAGSVVLPRYRIENGSVLWREGYEEEKVYNSSFLFAPDGRVIGRQDKVHLTPFEIKDLRLSAGSINDIATFETPLGSVGIAICYDGFMEDVLRALERKGADILIQPSASPGPWDHRRQAEWMMSVHMRTYGQGMFAYGVNPMINGSIWNLTFYGQSSITARDPAKQSGDNDILDTVDQRMHGYRDLEPRPGFIGVASTDNGDEVIVAVVQKP